MLSVCWAAKGGSGTTTVVAGTALACPAPVLLVDLSGDLGLALGMHEPERPGAYDWLASNAGSDRLGRLEQRLTDGVSLLAAGTRGTVEPARWTALANWLRGRPHHVLVDAGTGEPPAQLVRRANQALLVTRACYLGLRAAARLEARPSGIVLVDEPGRALRLGDVEAAVGAPVLEVVLADPAVARAVDAGLLITRLPRSLHRLGHLLSVPRSEAGAA